MRGECDDQVGQGTPLKSFPCSQSKWRPEAIRLKAHKCPGGGGKQLIANLSEGRVAAKATERSKRLKPDLRCPRNAPRVRK
jgi:hypothetical protein